LNANAPLEIAYLFSIAQRMAGRWARSWSKLAGELAAAAKHENAGNK